MVENIFVESSGSTQFALLLSTSQRDAFIANLSSEQLLEGKVVKVLSDNTFLIRFKGLEVVAESMIPLKPGQQIQVKVVQTHPQVMMSLLTGSIPEGKALSVLRTPVESLGNKQINLLLSPSQREAFITNLTSGQLLEGKVVRILSDTTFLVNFRGLEVAAESMIPLKPGQQIQARIAQTHPQVVMDLVKEVIPGQKISDALRVPAELPGNKQVALLLSPSQREAFIANLISGQLLEGKVVKTLGDTTFLVKIKGLEVVAESTISMKPGQQVQVKVVQIHPQVVMDLVTEMIPEQKALSLIRSYLPLQVHWGELIESLGKVLTGKELYLLEMVVDKKMLEEVLSCLSSITFNEDKVGDSNKVRQFIENSGLTYESKLKQSLLQKGRLPEHLEKTVEKDFKGLLLRISQKLEAAAERLGKGGDVILKGKMGDLLKVVNSSIKRIEFHQLVNYLTTKNDEQLVFQVPFALPEGIKTAELYIRYGGQKGKKKKGREDDFHIVFLLNLKGLGDLRIDARLFKKKISCKIQVKNGKTADFVKSHLAELSRQLESLDYKVEKIECIASSKGNINNVSLKGFSLLEMKLLDVVV
ncbi:MAG: flagellar hook-length control protein FliK [Deltaproteobacteria bacterium]|nr:flagellar hook-length control protein FliK [Deltaproteobacteria bacterium]